MKRDWKRMSRWVENLRSPLGNLMGQLELRQGEMDGECYRRLWEDCQNLWDHVEQLLRLIDVQTDESLPYWESVSIKERMDRALRTVHETARRKGIFLHSEYAQPDYKIWSDGRILQEMIEQLLKYVLQYCESGSALTLGVTVYGEQIHIWLESNGTQYLYIPEGEGEDGAGIEICRCLAKRLGADLFCVDAMRGGVRIGIRLPAAA